MARKPTDQASRGSVRMKELGARPVQLWLSPCEWAAAKAAANVGCTRLATYLRQYGLSEVAELVEQLRNNVRASPAREMATDRHALYQMALRVLLEDET